MAATLGVALLVWPVASALLLTIRWAGRALYRLRRRRSRIRWPNSGPISTPPATNPIPDGSPAWNTQRATTHTSTPHTSASPSTIADHRIQPMTRNYPRTEPR
ncbi:hypothetical protein [Streptomyces sp. SGAir0957]